MILLIDFDGTCVKHDFPRVGGNIGLLSDPNMIDA